MMPLYTGYTANQRVFFADFLKPSATQYEIHATEFDGAGGTWGTADFGRCSQMKSELIVDAIKDQYGKIFVWSDADILFTAETALENELLLGDNYVAAAKSAQHTYREINTGFMVIYACDRTLELFEAVARQRKDRRGRHDQFHTNRLLKKMKIRPVILPDEYFHRGLLHARHRANWLQRLPLDMRMFHATYFEGDDAKLKALRSVLATLAPNFDV